MSVIYVAPYGNDTTGTGSESQPFQSLDAAHTASSAGDTILLAPGEYLNDTGVVTISKDNITIQGPNSSVNPVGIVRTDEAILTLDSNVPSALIDIIGDNCTICGICVAHSLRPSIRFNNTDGGKVYANVLTGATGMYWDGHNVRINSSDNIEVYDNHIISSYGCVVTYAQTNHINIHHNDLSTQGNPNYNGAFAAVQLSGTSGSVYDILVHHNNIITAKGSGTAIAFSDYAPRTGIFTDCKVYANHISECRTGIGIYYGSLRMEIFDNTVCADEIGISVEWGSDDANIHDNSITGTALGILVDGWAGGYEEHNVTIINNSITCPVEHMEYVGAGIWVHNVQGTTIIQDNKIVLYSTHGPVGSNVVKEYYHGDAAGSCAGILISGGAASSVMEIFDNDVTFLEVESRDNAVLDGAVVTIDIDYPRPTAIYVLSNDSVYGSMDANTLLTIHNNTFTGSSINTASITVFDTVNHQYGNLISHVDVSNNVFANMEYGIHSDDNGEHSIQLIIARNCCWGDLTGPSGGEIDPINSVVADGNGAIVTANVEFFPWSDCNDTPITETQEKFTDKLRNASNFNNWKEIEGMCDMIMDTTDIE